MASVHEDGIEFKRRNVLDLAERVNVIKEYECLAEATNTRKYQFLAEKYECSVKQIKNIISHKEEILRSYNGSIFAPSMKTAHSRHDEFHFTRQEKIRLLTKIMFEYLQRVLYHRLPINEDKFRQKTLEFKECIPIENFKLSQLWFMNFQKAYNIVDFDLTHIQNNLAHFGEPERLSLNVADIIAYVSRMERKHIKEEIGSGEEQQSQLYQQPKLERNNDSYKDADRQKQAKLEMNANNGSQQQTTTTPAAAAKLSSNKRFLSPLPDIENLDQALSHLKVLEMYAMLQDNYRAIGLLTQLEDIFIKHPKRKF